MRKRATDSDNKIGLKRHKAVLSILLLLPINELIGE